MTVLNYNEITPKKVIVIDNEPFEVVSSHVFRKQQRKPVNQTRLKGLKSGRMIERTFHQSETAEEADLEKRTIKYIYSNKGEHWFSDLDNPKDRFSLSTDVVSASDKYLKENELVDALVFDDPSNSSEEGQIIGIKLPIKVELAVTEAPPSVKGNTAQGGVKQVTLESGAVVSVPLFINEGDIVRINTETGQYAERVEKR